MIRRLYIIIGLGCIALLLQGCPPPYYRIIYNNTGTDLIVQLKDRNVEWKVGTNIRIMSGFTIGFYKEITINWGELVSKGYQNTDSYSNFTILHGERVLKYRFKFFDRALPSEYIDRSNGPSTTAWQLERDYNLYITLPKSYFPVKMPIRQPTGYPSKPVTTDSGNRN